jgi:hypothetical protein
LLSQPGGEGHKAIILSKVVCKLFVNIKNRKIWQGFFTATFDFLVEEVEDFLMGNLLLRLVAASTPAHLS